MLPIEWKSEREGKGEGNNTHKHIVYFVWHYEVYENGRININKLINNLLGIVCNHLLWEINIYHNVWCRGSKSYLFYQWNQWESGLQWIYILWIYYI